MRDYLYNLATDRYGGLIASAIKFLLFILSLIYGAIVRILILFYGLKPKRLSCKVISVGNITLGGSGKTSLVEYIANYLKQQGRRVVILTRGYKKNSKLKTQNSKLSYEKMGDEPFMLANKLGDIPVIVDVDRIRGAKKAMEDYQVDTVLLDDGFQQWRIRKDLEIVTIDSTDPFGNQHLLPRGILREPLSSLKRADTLVLTKTNLNPDTVDLKDVLSRINPSALIIESIHQPMGFYKINQPDELLNVGILKGKTVTLVSGIGDPDSFENLIISLGINIGLAFRFPDHHHYSEKDLKKIVEASKKKNIDAIVTTEKDTVRLTSYLRPLTCNLQPFLVLRIGLKIIKNENEFHSRLLRLYSL